jgi:molybdenum cofactor cytidylyltransferase
VTVVLGPEPEPLREALSGTEVDIAINERWSDGLSSSLRLGIQSLPPGTSAVLIVLADQALVASDEYQRLLDVARTNPERPIAAAYDDTVGVPAVFPARYFERLSALQGDRGAGSLLKSDDQVVPIDMPSAAFDIDTPEQLAAALKDPETPVALMV